MRLPYSLLKRGVTSALAALGLIILCPSSRVGAVQARETTLPVRTLSQAGAEQVLELGKAEAERLHAPSAIAIVDPSGILLAFVRMDGVRPGSPDLAIGKARTSALLRRPSSETEDNVDGGRVAFITSGLMTLRGGMPLDSHGEVVGAIGVAGVNKDVDVKIAEAAATAFAAREAH